MIFFEILASKNFETTFLGGPTFYGAIILEGRTTNWRLKCWLVKMFLFIFMFGCHKCWGQLFWEAVTEAILLNVVKLQPKPIQIQSKSIQRRAGFTLFSPVTIKTFTTIIIIITLTQILQLVKALLVLYTLHPSSWKGFVNIKSSRSTPRLT